MTHVLGDREVIRALEKLKASSRRRVVRPGVAAAGKIINKAIRDQVPLSDETLAVDVRNDSTITARDYRKSIGRRRKTYARSGVVLESIGPRYSYQTPSGGRPSAFAWSIEFGTLEAPARPWIRAGFDGSRARALTAARAGMAQGLAKETARLRARR